MSDPHFSSNWRARITAWSSVAVAALLLVAGSSVVFTELERNAMVGEHAIRIYRLVRGVLVATMLFAAWQTLRRISGACQAELAETRKPPTKSVKEQVHALYDPPPRAIPLPPVGPIPGSRGPVSALAEPRCAACGLPVEGEHLAGQQCPACGLAYHDRCWRDRKGVCVDKDCPNSQAIVPIAVRRGDVVSDGMSSLRRVPQPPPPPRPTAVPARPAVPESTRRCPYCGKAVTDRRSAMTCPSCGTMHHYHCWSDHAGCGKRRCGLAPMR